MQIWDVLKTNFTENTAVGGFGGGMVINYKVNLSMVYSRFFSNSAKADGGAVDVQVIQSCANHVPT